jgi:hypothetical protein
MDASRRADSPTEVPTAGDGRSEHLVTQVDLGGGDREPLLLCLFAGHPEGADLESADATRGTSGLWAMGSVSVMLSAIRIRRG